MIEQQLLWALLLGLGLAALGMAWRRWAWPGCGGSRLPLQRHYVFRPDELLGRPVLLEVAQTVRPDGDGLMNVIAVVKPIGREG